MSRDNLTVWKVSKYGVFSGPYFPLFRLNTEIYSKSPYSVGIQENTDQKKLCIWTLFTQCLLCARESLQAFLPRYVRVASHAVLIHGTIIGTGITCNKTSCYMRDSACRWLIVENTKIFYVNKVMLKFFEFPHVKEVGQS